MANAEQREPSPPRTDLESQPSAWCQHDACFLGWLLLLVVGVYFPVVGHDFLLFDDPKVVTENAHVQQGISVESLRWAGTTTHFSNWHPLTWMSLMLDWELYGDHPAGFHLTNLLLHCGAVVCLFVALQRMTGQAWPSFLVAALFAIHPLHVQSVAWIAERKGLLSTLFWMAALVAYVEYARRPSIWRYGCVVVALILSLLSKQMAVTLPCALLLLDYWPLQRHRRLLRVGETAVGAWCRLAVEKVPLLLIAFSFCFVAYFAQAGGGALRSLDEFPFPYRMANAVVAYAAYLRKVVWPSDLSFHYHNYGEYPAPLELISAIAILSTCIAVAIWSRQKRPSIAFGVAWYLGTLLPVIGLVQIGDHRMADRYVDVPIVGVFIAIAFSLPLSAYSATNRRWAWRAAIGGVLVALGCAAHAEVGYWSNSEMLFRRALTLDSRNPKAHTNLGVYYARAGQLDAAVTHYRQTLAVLPDDAFANSNLGDALAKQGKVEEAIQHFRRTLDDHPEYADARLNLSSTLARHGQFAEAEGILADMLRDDPQNWMLHGNLAAIYARQAKLPAALDEYRIALGLNPHEASLNFNFAECCGRVDEWEPALAYYLKTIDLNPNVLDAYLGAARASVHLNEPSRASTILQVAWQRWPGQPAILSEIGKSE